MFCGTKKSENTAKTDQTMSGIEFLKMAKTLSLYPVSEALDFDLSCICGQKLVTLEAVKQVVVQKSGAQFSFDDFVLALKVSILQCDQLLQEHCHRCRSRNASWLRSHQCQLNSVRRSSRPPTERVRSNGKVLEGPYYWESADWERERARGWPLSHFQRHNAVEVSVHTEGSQVGSQNTDLWGEIKLDDSIRWAGHTW